MVRKENAKGPVVYWMGRDQRACDNWALLHAKGLAEKYDSPLAVVFCLVPKFLGATSRQYGFMLQGLKEVERNLRDLDIAFFLLQGDPGREIPTFLSEQGASSLVCDFSPLRQSRIWRSVVAGEIEIPFYEVDAHNIVPCWLASPKAEWAAYSFRPKIHRLLPEFMDEFPPIKKHHVPWKDDVRNDWRSAESGVEVDAVPEANFNRSGEVAAAAQSMDFIENKLSSYESNRNDPSQDGQSNLSPYLHFGQISAQRVALQVLASMKDAGAFLEELIVRRELSDNFCYYNPNYDSFQAFPKWARETLEKHAKDRREYLYTAEELERARTVNGGLKVSNSGGIKLSTCQSLALESRGNVDVGCGGVPHVARFIQPRIEHQRDRQTDRTQPSNGAQVSEFTDSPFAPEENQETKQTGWPQGIHNQQAQRMSSFSQPHLS